MPLDEFEAFPEDKQQCIKSINYPVLILGQNEFLFKEDVENIFNFLDHRLEDKKPLSGEELRFDLSVALHESTLLGSVCCKCGNEASKVALPLPNFNNFNLFSDPSKIFFCKNCSPNFLNFENFDLKKIKFLKNSENYSFLVTVSAYASSIAARYKQDLENDLVKSANLSVKADSVFYVLFEDLDFLKKKNEDFLPFGKNIFQDVRKIRTYTNWRATSVVENMRVAPIRFDEPLGETDEDIDELIDFLKIKFSEMNEAKIENYPTLQRKFIYSFVASHVEWFKALERSIIDDDASSLWCLIVASFLLRFPETIFES